MTPLMKALVTLMFTMIANETPGFRQDPDSEKAMAFKEDIAKMAEIDQKIGSQGLLVSPEVDPIILGGIRFYEARYKSEPRDGDCQFKVPTRNGKRTQSMVYCRHTWCNRRRFAPQ